MEQPIRRRPWGSGSRGPWGSGPQSQGPRPPDLEEFLRRGQDKLRGLLPGNLGGRGIALIALVAIVLWGFSGFFRVEPDELGVVLRFGKFVREVQPGLNYHLPYPIETALTPQALRVNKIDIGMRGRRLRRGTTMRDVPEESLMLTGDENIVDVDFSVLWKVKPSAGRRLSVQRPESRRHRKGRRRKRHARGDRPLEYPGDPHRRAADHRDRGAGADAEDARRLRRRRRRSSRSSCRRSIRPTQVIDAFRDVQAARSDLERAQNEAQTYANRVVPEARGRAAKITQDAEAYREQTVADAKGQTSRFLADLRAVQEGARRDPRAHVSRNHGARPRRHRQDDHRYRPAGRARRRAVSAAQ